MKRSKTRIRRGFNLIDLNRSKTRVRSGFTLIEMIVATMVLAIGVMGAMAAFNVAAKASRTASDLQTATMLAEQQLNNTAVQQALQGSLSGGDTEGDFEDYPGFHWKQSIDTTDYTSSNNLYQVSVTITWGGVRKQSRTISTYMISQNIQSTNGSNSSTGTSSTSGQ